jgi:hypothetical protein
MRALTAAHAALTGTTENTAAFQAGLVEIIREMGREAKLTDEEINLLLVSLGLLSAEHIATIEVEADQLLEEADHARRTLQALIDNPWVAVLAAIDNGSLTIAGLVASATGYAQGDYNPSFFATDAGASDAINGLVASATGYATGTYDPGLFAHDVNAADTIDRIHRAGRDYHDDLYDPGVYAHDVNASSTFEDSRTAGRSYADDVYDAEARAHDENVESTFSTAQKLATTWNQTTATATVNVDGNAVVRLNNILGLIAQVQRSGGSVSGSSGSSSRGGGSPVRVLAEGGIVSAFPDGGISTDPNRSAIYRAATPFRIFAEAGEAPWESFISGSAAHRARSLAVWAETGRLLGAFAGNTPALSAVGAPTRSVAALSSVTAGPNGRQLVIENLIVPQGRDVWQELALLDTMHRAGAV